MESRTRATFRHNVKLGHRNLVREMELYPTVEQASVVTIFGVQNLVKPHGRG